MEQSKTHPHHLKLILSMSILVGMALVALVVLGVLRRGARNHEETALKTHEQKGRSVEVAEVKSSPKHRRVLMMGESRAYYSVTLYARVSGYLTELHADIGDVVKEGQLLARVES